MSSSVAPSISAGAASSAPESPRELEALFTRITDDVHAGKLAIPPFPKVALELHKIARSPRPDIVLACQLIERQAELAGRVVQAACAPIFGGRPVSKLQEAALRLGTDGLRNVAMAASMGRVLRGRVAGRVRDVMMHSFVVAVTAHRLSGLTGADANQGYMLGLFHDIGRVVIAIALDEYGQRAPALLEPDAGQRIADALHERIGAAVVESWGLGELAVDVAAHHQPVAPITAARGHVGAVRVADIADRLPVETAEARQPLLVAHPDLAGANLSPSHLQIVAAHIDTARADNVFNTFTA